MAGVDSRIIAWLCDRGRRLSGLPELFHGLCTELEGNGLQPMRATLALSTLHPQIEALRYVWRRGTGEPPPFDYPLVFRRQVLAMTDATVEETLLSHGCLDTPGFQRSPFFEIRSGADRVRVRIDPRDPDRRFPLIADLAREGATDYLAIGLLIGDGPKQTLSVVTDRAGGFSDAQVAALEAVEPVLSLCLRAQLERLILETLLGVYVGTHPTSRVLAGRIRPGQVETLRAALWYSDLRGFTSLTNEAADPQMVAWLNEYLRVVVGAVYAAGGEVLKFVGDAVLAVFPFSDQPDDACRRAFQSARAAGTALAELNLHRREAGAPALRHGIALHVGDVQYGNIGALQRLDFTVIGTAVNMAARIEGLCSTLEATLLASAELAHHVHGLVSRGTHRVKGFDAPIEVFAPVADH